MPVDRRDFLLSLRRIWTLSLPQVFEKIDAEIRNTAFVMWSAPNLAIYADILWARHAIFLPDELSLGFSRRSWGRKIAWRSKECLRRSLCRTQRLVGFKACRPFQIYQSAFGIAFYFRNFSKTRIEVKIQFHFLVYGSLSNLCVSNHIAVYLCPKSWIGG